MKSLQGACTVLLLFTLIFSNSFDSCAQGKCLNDQKALLLQLNQSLISVYRDPDHPFIFSSKRDSWRLNTDCCSWDGIGCDSAGRVISLDLGGEYLIGGLNSSSSLFSLQNLERLNLADNHFEVTSAPIPSGLDKLGNLTYLNMSGSGFIGQIPIGISRLTSLVILHLSSSYLFDDNDNPFPKLIIKDPDLETLTRNLTGLRQLLLDSVRISERGNKWCRSLSSSLPKLQVLSLEGCELSGPLDSSLLRLQSLRVLRLSDNHISSEIPDFLGDFPNLVTFVCESCELYGKFPERLLKVKTLRNLDLSLNGRLQGFLPAFPEDGRLQELVLAGTGFGGEIPTSIGNLRLLTRLDLDQCRFSGSIPHAISNLKQLQNLDLSLNNFTGLIPSISWLESLIHIDLSGNSLVGPIPWDWNRLLKLVYLDLDSNSLNESIPASLFTLPSLQNLNLAQNQFTGVVGEFSKGSFSQLEFLDLSENKLQGRVPVSIFEMPKLRKLLLSGNDFSDSISLDMIFHKFKNLSDLDLSGNRLSVNTTTPSADSALYPKLEYLGLSSCNLTQFPIFLKYQSQMQSLDLSNNHIHGKIPNWFGKIDNGSLRVLNLSYNFLEDPSRPLPVDSFKSMISTDFRSNRLQGKNLILPLSTNILDYSSNNLTAMIPNISSYLGETIYLSLSRNQITGEIPSSICHEATQLQVLDLSYNNLSGPIPPCLGSIEFLTVLDLRGNNFQGSVPDTFPQTCSMVALNLNGNKLEGQLPRSLTNCKMLKVLDLGNNQLAGTFPYWLKSMSQLRVLVLRSNKFHGAWGNQGANYNFSALQIIDVSSNNFSGTLSKDWLLSLKAMMVKEKEAQRNHENQILEFNTGVGDVYYQQIVTVKQRTGPGAHKSRNHFHKHRLLKQ
ncbi:receptor-like protein 6 isoform X2 [Papaver somniferum]|uniref:receptor-like protein 6 isoform X2 n=1 Tax=Papaver somniferum TaxID=3469 RepID=UPI000E7023C8|nr:receptor-like protein 6 isoform X2 [Papaver somniferum]